MGLPAYPFKLSGPTHTPIPQHLSIFYYYSRNEVRVLSNTVIIVTIYTIFEKKKKLIFIPFWKKQQQQKSYYQIGPKTLDCFLQLSCRGIEIQIEEVIFLKKKHTYYIYRYI